MGRKCGIVERFIHNVKVHGIRSDLFGFIDIIALCPDRGIVGIQTCDHKFSEHYKKITIEKRENAMDWLRAGGKIEIWSWRKVVAVRGRKRMVWDPRIADITMSELENDS